MFEFIYFSQQLYQVSAIIVITVVVIIIIILRKSFSVYSPSCPGTCFVDQAGLKLIEIRLPLPPKCWD